MEKTVSDIRLAPLLPATKMGKLLTIVAPVIERIVGLTKLRQLYGQHQLAGLDAQAFSEKLLKILGVNIQGIADLQAKIPKKGRLIVVCNHPYGMIEGVILAQALTMIRSDTKVMANVGLTIFIEINDYFIYANPLKPRSPINTKAIKQAFTHLNNDGLLVLFPAGRVSFYQANKQRITDGQWNRLTVQLANKTQADILPVFISGTNSVLFHRLGRIYYRFRLLMLAREMVKLKHQCISLYSNKMISPNNLAAFGDIHTMNDMVRLQCYLNDPQYIKNWPADNKVTTQKPIITQTDGDLLLDEIVKLPEKQRLVEYKHFSVSCGFLHQLPNTVREITRLREITFRTLNEGSGEACDTDNFDATYLHLFIFDHQAKEIIGAYRIGLTDQLLGDGDISQLYLSQMFNFSPEFINRQQPCMEMGRSFIVEKHQKCFYGLYLLWRGIGTFVCRNPQYRTLYGTVSLSKVYDPRTVALINETMVTKSQQVTAKTAFEGSIHPELSDYLQTHELSSKQLSILVQGIEKDGKDVPILLKQYQKLGAIFHCLGIDSEFNHTPGLLLSVDLTKAPKKLLNLYLGDGADDFLTSQ